MPKCVQCKNHEEESTCRYAKRIRYSFDNPFLCKFCARILEFSKNPEKAEQKTKYHLALLERNKTLKTFNKIAHESEFLNSEIEISLEKIRIKQRAYRKTENGKKAFRNGYAKRRANVLNALVDINAEECANIKEFYLNRPDGFHVDHIIPLSKGGKHCMSNLQYLSSEENLRKHDKIDKYLIESFCEGKEISSCILMRKFKLTFEDANKIMQEIL